MSTQAVVRLVPTSWRIALLGLLLASVADAWQPAPARYGVVTEACNGSC
jgi:hypothetical protein